MSCRFAHLWCIEVTTEASKAVKTSASCRLVPLHPALINASFIDFVKGIGGKAPLFYEYRPKRNGIATHNPGKSRNNHLGDWIRSLGLPGVGRAHRCDSIHGVRHWFKAAARSCGIADTVSDAISGHAPTSEAARYGSRDMDIASLAEAVAKLRLPVPVGG